MQLNCEFVGFLRTVSSARGDRQGGRRVEERQILDIVSRWPVIEEVAMVWTPPVSAEDWSAGLKTFRGCELLTAGKGTQFGRDRDGWYMGGTRVQHDSSISRFDLGLRVKGQDFAELFGEVESELATAVAVIRSC